MDNTVIDVLSIARGDMRLTFSGDSEEEREKAAKVIDTMLRSGYSIMVETKAGLRRVKKYNPKRHEYVVVESPSVTASKPEKTIPVEGTKAKAVGATAGG